MTAHTAYRLDWWAGCVRRLLAAAPIEAVAAETGTTDWAESVRIVDSWLARDWGTETDIPACDQQADPALVELLAALRADDKDVLALIVASSPALRDLLLSVWDWREYHRRGERQAVDEELETAIDNYPATWPK